MKLPSSLNFLLVLLLSSGLAFTACGEAEDPGDDRGDQQQDQQQQDDQDDDGCESDEDCDDGDVCNESTGECFEPECTEATEDEDCADDEVCEDYSCVAAPEDIYVEPAEETPTCGDGPDRCNEDPAEFEDFGPASYVDHLEIADDPDEPCCIDFTGSGEFSDDPNAVDNQLPNLIGILEDEDTSVNDEIEAAIDAGEIAIVLEHEGLDADDLDDLDDGGEYDNLNLLFAEDVPGEEATIEPASFEDGVHPHALLIEPSITEVDGTYQMTAGPGSVVLSLDLASLVAEIDGNVEIDLTISNAMMRADVVGTDISGGVQLENGEIGGLVRFQDVVTALNEFGETCECLGEPEELLDEEDECVLEQEIRDEVADEERCTGSGEEQICAELAQFCGALGFATAFADIDTTGDDDEDAFSTGLRFEASATTIAGVAAEDDNGENGNDD